MSPPNLRGKIEPASPDANPRRDHTVVLAEDEPQSITATAQFVAAGLLQTDRVLVIATTDHVRELCQRLSGLFDIDDARQSGQLIVRDAHETLASFMVDGSPSTERFDAVVGRLVDDILAAAPEAAPLRVFGEMVDLLYRDGNPEAALRLEELWTSLVERTGIWLLCGYSKAGLERVDPAYADRIRLAHAHTHVVATPGVRNRVFDFTQRAREVARSRVQGDDAASFRLLVESVLDYGIFMLDPNGVVTTWNAGAARINGYAAHQIIGQHFSKFFLPEDVAAGKCQNELEVARAAGRFVDEGWRVRKDGSRFWAAIVMTALRDEQGTLVGFAKVTRDLTERREAEEGRLRLVQEQEANRAKDDFLATVSHELRNPLHSILGWSSLLKDQLTDPSAKKTAATILRNAEVQARLIDDLLDVSRIVAGKLELEYKLTDLVGLVRETVEEARPRAELKGLAVSFRCTEAVTLMIDPQRFRQVVTNLLSNAIKFTDAGSISVELGYESDSWRLSVQDTGRGIDRDFLPRVFERFTQSETTRRQRAGGLGLGLAIVQHLVELHGGSISVDSEGPGKGSTFAIALPAR